MGKSSTYPASSSALGIINFYFMLCYFTLLQFSHSFMCIASQSGFHLHFSNNVEHLVCLLRIYIFFKFLFKLFVHFVNRIFSLSSFFFFFFSFFKAAPAACGGSQAQGLLGGVATSLCQSHSNARSKPSLQPATQLMATPDP